MANYWIVIAIILFVPVLMFYTAFRIVKFIAYDPDETFRMDQKGMLHIFLALTLVAVSGYVGTKEMVLKPEVKSLTFLYCSDSTSKGNQTRNEENATVTSNENGADKEGKANNSLSENNISLQSSFRSHLCRGEFKGKFVEFMSIAMLSFSQSRKTDGGTLTTIIFLSFVYAMNLGFLLILLVSCSILFVLCVLVLTDNNNSHNGTTE